MKVKLFDSYSKATEILVDNQPRKVLANGKELCIVRRGSRMFVFQNACPHMKATLHQGSINFLNEIVCPMHTFRFNMESGEEAEHRCGPMKTYPVFEEAGSFYIDC